MVGVCVGCCAAYSPAAADYMVASETSESGCMDYCAAFQSDCGVVQTAREKAEYEAEYNEKFGKSTAAENGLRQI